MSSHIVCVKYEKNLKSKGLFSTIIMTAIDMPDVMQTVLQTTSRVNTNKILLTRLFYSLLFSFQFRLLLCAP